MKKFIISLSLAAMAALALCSCSNTVYVSLEPNANAYWCGKTHAEVVQTYGAPTRETSDGQGGKILIYEETKTTVNTYSTDTPVYGGFYGFYYHMSGPVHTNTEVNTETDYAHFFINDKGVCYKVSTNLKKAVDPDEKE